MNQKEKLLITKDNAEIEVLVDAKERTLYLSQKELEKLYGKTNSAIAKRIRELRAKEDISVQKVSNNCPIIVQYSGKRNTSFYSLEIIKELDLIWNQNNYQYLKELLDNYLSKNVKNVQYYDTIDNKVITFKDDGVVLDVRVSPKEDTVWLNQNEIAYLFETTQPNISLHIKNILKDGELENSVHKDFLYTGKDGKTYQMSMYNLDMILSIGYRVKSSRAIIFRKWANSVLKQYLIKGYALNEDRLAQLEQGKVNNDNEHSEIFKRLGDLETTIANIVPRIKKEQIFYSGELYDSFEFVRNIINSAQEEVVIIDPYFDDTCFNYIKTNISLTIVLYDKQRISSLVLEKYKKQYKHINLIEHKGIHDRFIIIDDKDIYLLGASLNSLGYKSFSIIKLSETSVSVIKKMYEDKDSN